MTDSPMPQLVKIDRLEEGSVLRLVMDKPKGNVLDSALMGALDAALTAHEDDPGLKLVVLQGAGGVFSFGASVEEHQRETVAAMLATFHSLVRKMASYPIPLAAVVEGHCLGGGFELALCCHFVFANPAAVFSCPEIQLGVFPPVLAAVGPLRLGGARSERMILTGEKLTTEDAVRIGFALPLNGDEEIEDQILAWYRKNLSRLSASSLRQATRASRVASGMLEAMDSGLAECERHYLEDLVATHDANEGIEAFMQKRRPVWQNR